DAARPGDQLVLGVILDIEAGYHIYPDKTQIDPASFLMPTEVTLVQGEGLLAERALFPEPHYISVEYQEEDVPSLEGKVQIFLPVKVGEEVSVGPLSIQVDLKYLACNATQCLMPLTLNLKETLKIVPKGTAVNGINSEIFAGLKELRVAQDVVGFDIFGIEFSIDASSWFGLGLLLLTAMLGGMLLNFTPCVLPVIPIKIISLSQTAGNRARCLALGISMSLGVTAFWLGLGILISAVTGFTATNQLFQYPVFTITVGVVIAVMAVGMTGLFALQLPSSISGFAPKHETLSGSFMFGIMTAILSTPCTAPFMGAAAAWASTQYAATTLATFGAIGAGMALPYLVLSAAPGLAQKMPRTGAASQLIKEVMGLFLLAAAAYFIGAGLSSMLSTAPEPPNKFYWWVVMGFFAGAAVWMAYRTVRITSSKVKRVVFVGLGGAIVMLALFGGLRLTEEGPIDWVYYTPDRFASALKDGNVVVMDFTAEWCLNCKALEHSVLNNQNVVQLLAADGVVPIKVDITGNNPDGKAQLKDAGRLTIPLLVIYSHEGEEIFKSDFYTVEQVLDAVKQARKSQQASSGTSGQ
ncbi:MAG: cytochrome c biogenesis protein CcdA, partial [Planctomycetota bacterium]